MKEANATNATEEEQHLVQAIASIFDYKFT